MAADKIDVRLRWADGHEEVVRGGVDAEASVVQYPGPKGFHRFRETDEIDDEGYAIYVEETSSERAG